MRLAFVYDRLNKIGGAEQILVALHELFPQAPWYTSVWDPGRAPFSRGWRVITSPLNRVPWLRTHHEWVPFLMPFAFEAFDLSAYDLVVSVGSAEAKGIITRPGTLHLHYCLTPTRYLYSHATVYLTNPLSRLIARPLRAWDQIAATRPDIMMAISTQVKIRIQKYYHRESEVIFPPVDTQKFSTPVPKWSNGVMVQWSNYFLVVSRLVPYKQIDVLVRAANLASVHLVIIGTGSEFARLRRLAGPTVHLLGHIPDSELPGYYQHCQAYLQANEEDFGITMVEAQAAGKPVIARAGGGAEDIIQSPATGILLSVPTPQIFADALQSFRAADFDPAAGRLSAARFDKIKWQKQMQERIKSLWTNKISA